MCSSVSLYRFVAASALTFINPRNPAFPLIDPMIFDVYPFLFHIWPQRAVDIFISYLATESDGYNGVYQNRGILFVYLGEDVEVKAIP
jgi:hypothetical protein